MMWYPLSVETIPLISPTFKLKAASSKGFCISPRLKRPKSPPFWQLEHSEKLEASYLNNSGLALSWLRKDWMLAMASSLERVIGLLRKESTGRRDSLCFCRMWAHLIDIQIFKRFINQNNNDEEIIMSIITWPWTPRVPRSQISREASHLEILFVVEAEAWFWDCWSCTW